MAICTGNLTREDTPEPVCSWLAPPYTCFFVDRGRTFFWIGILTRPHICVTIGEAYCSFALRIAGHSRRMDDPELHSGTFRYQHVELLKRPVAVEPNHLEPAVLLVVVDQETICPLLVIGYGFRFAFDVRAVHNVVTGANSLFRPARCVDFLYVPNACQNVEIARGGLLCFCRYCAHE